MKKKPPSPKKKRAKKKPLLKTKNFFTEPNFGKKYPSSD